MQVDKKIEAMKTIPYERHVCAYFSEESRRWFEPDIACNCHANPAFDNEETRKECNTCGWNPLVQKQRLVKAGLYA